MYGIELTPEHPIDRIVDLGVAAEQQGFEAAFIGTHYFNRDPFVAAARLAAATDEIRVGPAAANPYDTHPVALASRMATLHEESNGRGIFGIGPGDESTTNSLGIERDRPLRRVLESFEAARDLWAGERVSMDGTFRADDAGLEYDVTGEIPVYVAGQGPHMVRMSAKRADGLLLNASHPDDVEWAAKRVEEGLAERTDSGAFEFLVYASVSIAKDREAAREAARPPVSFIASGSPPPVLERHGIDPDRAKTVGAAIERGDFTTAYDTVSPAMIDAFSIAGTPELVAERCEALLAHADGIVFGSPLGPDLAAAVELAGDVLSSVPHDPDR